MRTFWLVSGCVLGLACQGPAAAQTAVEYGAAGSAAATATATTKGVGSSLGGVLDSLGKALNQGQDQVSKGGTGRQRPPRNRGHAQVQTGLDQRGGCTRGAAAQLRRRDGHRERHELRGSDTPLRSARHGIRRRG